MKITQPEVVIPRWAEVASTTLAQHRYLSQEKELIGWVWPDLDGGINLGDTSPLFMNGETKKLFEPMSESTWDFYKRMGLIAGSTCRWCPDPLTDGYDTMFPVRCNDCATLNSYRARSRKAARKLLAIKRSLDLESVLWTFTFPIVKSNRPLEQDEIVAIAKARRVFISQNLLRDKNIWHDQFVGINVMECTVTEPGETRKARFYDDQYERTSNMWTYHIHGHYLVLNHKKSKVNLDLAYAKFGKTNVDVTNHLESGTHTDEVIQMRLWYKHESDYDPRYLDSTGETIGARDEMKIMRDYLVGYARKDCLGKLAWNGDKNWLKVRSTDEYGNYFDEDGEELWYD